jgi:type II secretory pathway component PulF
MAKADDLEPLGWEELPLPIPSAKPVVRRPMLQRLGLRHIMVALVYFAILFWVGKNILDSESYPQMVLLGVLLGLGLCAAGLWAATKMKRFSFVGWFVFVLGSMAITASTTGIFIYPIQYILVGLIMYLGLLIGSIVYLCLRRHSNNQEALLWVLTVAADRGMPLAPGVLAFSSQVSGIFEVWSESLAELLRRGVSLPVILDGMPMLVPRSSALLIRLGSESDNLARGLREAVDARSRKLPIFRSIGARIGYICWVMFTGTGIVGFVMYYIIPKFEAIFRDFGIELPEITILMIRGSHYAIEYAWVPVLTFLVLGFTMLIKLMIGRDMSLPLVDRLFARRHTILILRGILVVVESQRPLASALTSLGQCYPTHWVRQRLKNAALDVSQGWEWVEALRSNDLISASDAGVLSSAQRAGNLGWAIRELAETSERRWGYRLQALTQVVFLLSMLVLGGFVFLLAVAYFAPLTTLIMRLSQ